MTNSVDQLALDFVALGLELEDLNPAQKRELAKSLDAPMRQTRLVVRRDAQFRSTPLNKSMQEARPAPLAPERAQTAPPTLTHKEIGYRLQRAAQDGGLDVEIAGKFYTSPEIALQRIPFDVRVKYCIPETLTGAVQKSGATQDEPVSHGQIRARLLRAVQRGAIEPQFLGMFDAYPDRALRALPFDVKKSYGLPETLSAILRKS